MSVRTAVQISLALAVFLLPSVLLADDAQHSGKAVFVRYCGSCHGPDARGDGSVAFVLTAKPPDLTTIAKRNKGEFPSEQVAKAIDGRTTLRAHGDPDMPVWGEIFDEEAAEAGEPPAAIRKKVQLITEYLGSIQIR